MVELTRRSVSTIVLTKKKYKCTQTVIPFVFENQVAYGTLTTGGHPGNSRAMFDSNFCCVTPEQRTELCICFGELSKALTLFCIP